MDINCIHGLTFARRLSGDALPFAPWDDARLRTLRDGLAGDVTAYYTFGDYDLLMHHRIPACDPTALEAVREVYARILEQGFDSRLTVGLAVGDLTREEPCPPEPAHPLICVTLVRLNDGYSNGARDEKLRLALDFIVELARSTMPPGGAVENQVLISTGHVDLVLIQWGTSYTELQHAVRVLRHSTVAHVKDWAEAQGRACPDIDPVALEQKNHLCSATYSIFGFSWNADLSTLSSAGHSEEPPAPVLFLAYHPGHETKPSAQFNAVFADLAEATPVKQREVIGVFERLAIPTFEGGRPEALVTRLVLEATKRFFQQSTLSAGPDFYKTNTVWTMEAPTFEQVIERIAEDSVLRRIFREHGPSPDHGFLSAANDRMVHDPDRWARLREIIAEHQFAGSSVDKVTRQLQRLFTMYRLFASSDYLGSAVEDLAPFLRPLLNSLPTYLERCVARRQTRHYVETLCQIIHDLSICLEHRLNFTSFSFKHELAYYDSSAMHKVLRGFGATARALVARLRPHLQFNVHVFLYVSSTVDMESEWLLDTEEDRFLVVRVGFDNLFDPTAIIQVIHEIAHHLYFYDFAIDKWIGAYASSVARTAVRWLRNAAPEFEGWPAAPATPILEATLSDLLQSTLIRQREMESADDLKKGVIRTLAPKLQDMIATVLFSSAVTRTIVAKGEDGEDVAEMRRRLDEDPRLQDHLLRTLHEAIATQCETFTEAMADVLSARLVEPDRYLQYMELMGSKNQHGQPDVQRRKEILVDVFADPDEGIVPWDPPLVGFLRYLLGVLETKIGAPVLDGPVGAGLTEWRKWLVQVMSAPDRFPTVSNRASSSKVI